MRGVLFLCMLARLRETLARRRRLGGNVSRTDCAFDGAVRKDICYDEVCGVPSPSAELAALPLLIVGQRVITATGAYERFIAATESEEVGDIEWSDGRGYYDVRLRECESVLNVPRNKVEAWTEEGAARLRERVVQDAIVLVFIVLAAIAGPILFTTGVTVFAYVVVYGCSCTPWQHGVGAEEGGGGGRLARRRSMNRRPSWAVAKRKGGRRRGLDGMQGRPTPSGRRRRAIITHDHTSAAAQSAAAVELGLFGVDVVGARDIVCGEPVKRDSIDEGQREGERASSDGGAHAGDASFVEPLPESLSHQAVPGAEASGDDVSNNLAPVHFESRFGIV